MTKLTTSITARQKDSEHKTRNERALCWVGPCVVQASQSQQDGPTRDGSPGLRLNHRCLGSLSLDPLQLYPDHESGKISVN